MPGLPLPRRGNEGEVIEKSSKEKYVSTKDK